VGFFRFRSGPVLERFSIQVTAEREPLWKLQVGLSFFCPYCSFRVAANLIRKFGVRMAGSRAIDTRRTGFVWLYGGFYRKMALMSLTYGI
jgi:hypothetical protein